jgi:hypothetical protein
MACALENRLSLVKQDFVSHPEAAAKITVPSFVHFTKEK